jgi:hypothetical protein
MGLYIGSMVLTIISNMGYHLAQRSISGAVNPLVSLLVTYLVALTATLVALPFFAGTGAAGGSVLDQLKAANWASYALGLAAVGLELGFLLVYRAGWKISLAALTSNAIVTVLLIPVGLLFFHEQLGLKKMVGIVFATVGLWLIGG